MVHGQSTRIHPSSPRGRATDTGSTLAMQRTNPKNAKRVRLLPVIGAQISGDEGLREPGNGILGLAAELHHVDPASPLRSCYGWSAERWRLSCLSPVCASIMGGLAVHIEAAGPVESTRDRVP